MRKAGVSTLALDHQGKLQSGERYQQKTAFGTSFKRHLSRSYAQLEPRDHGDGFLTLTLRHQKQNFAPLVDPFGIRVEFEQSKVLVTKEDLEESELAEEETINARTRVYKALKSFENEEGTKSDVCTATGLAEGTVKKELAGLKREAPPRVWETGRFEGRQAIVTTKEPSGSGSGSLIGSGTGTAKQPGEQRAQTHPLGCRCTDCAPEEGEAKRPGSPSTARRLSEEEAQQIQRLISEGMAPRFARADAERSWRGS